MNFKYPEMRQFRRPLSVLLVFNLITLVFLLFAWIITSHFDVDMAYFTRDPAAKIGFHPLYGAISHMGVLLWGASATLCFFVASIYRDHLFKGSHRYLFVSGLVMLGHLLDDLFLIHEEMAPYYLHIEQNTVYGIYLLVALGQFKVYSHSILKTEFIILLAALFYMALSVLIDYFEDKGLIDNWYDVLFEDGFKFLGIVTWFIYFFRLSTAIVRSEKQED